MKLFLFGGAESSLGQFEPQLKLIEKVLKQIKAKQLLHIPFARTKASESEWMGDWFNRNIHIKGLDYLNAGRRGDIQRVKRPVIFISGGSEHRNLIKKISTSPLLLRLIKNADYVIGESAGSMVTAEYFLSGKLDWPERRVLKGLGLLKSTILIPHYTERNQQTELIRRMDETGATYGIGIDCATAMVFDLKDFPKKYQTIGSGKVEVKERGGSIRVIKDVGASVYLDGNKDLGPIAANKAVHVAAKKARQYGIGLVGLRNILPFPHPGIFAKQLAEQGLIGIVMIDGGRGKGYASRFSLASNWH